MQYVISILIATVIAVLAGWQVYRDSHKKSLTAVTTAAILAFSLIMTGISVYLPDFSRGFLDGWRRARKRTMDTKWRSCKAGTQDRR